MIIRDASKRDALQIATIWNHVIRDSSATFTTQEKTAQNIADLIEASEAFLVAEDRGEVLGFCTMGAFRTGPGYAGCRELTIHLTKAARGQGIGRELVETLEARARKLGIHSLIGGISGSNILALTFHKALGFQEVGRLPEIGRKFNQRFDLVFMLKKL